jgi:trehalose-phosphatase
MQGLVTGHDFRRAEKADEMHGTIAPVERLDAFFRTFANGALPLLLLDYDGTLAPFRKDRTTARPWSGVREILTAIQQQGSTRMVVITGRPAEEIAPLLALPNPVEVWGLHGAEHLYPDGRKELEHFPEATRQKLDQLRTQLSLNSFGGLFEDKANGAVMHWRGASPEKAQQIREKTMALFAPLAGKDGLALLQFESGVELRAGRDKGGAVTQILEQTAPDSPVAFLGDDYTDESAFLAINTYAKNGLSILIRPESRPTKAQLWLQPPAELKAFLKRWQSACAGSKD